MKSRSDGSRDTAWRCLAMLEIIQQIRPDSVCLEDEPILERLVDAVADAIDALNDYVTHRKMRP